MDSIQDILSLVENPSHYLGSEVNRVVKDRDKVKLNIALAFPDRYEIGTSHFGIQILYHVLNRHADICAERVFAPGLDMAALLKKAGTPLMTLESKKPLSRFDMIGFSLLYELNYTNVLLMLDLAGIPFFSRHRDTSYPFVIAGGPCTVNPEPVADFFDAMVVGDGETVVVEMSAAWFQWRSGGARQKDELLSVWSKIEGVYVPSMYGAFYDGSGFQRFVPAIEPIKRVKRAVFSDLDRAPFPDAPLVPYGKPVHDRLRLEISRGCTRGCRFCQAGMIYRPVRERAPGTVVDLFKKALNATGYEDLSLLSLSTGDYTCISSLLQTLMARCEPEHVAVSLPSLRAGTLTPEIMQLIRKVRKTGFTIAPEAGSQRLRDVINKNIHEEEIVSTVLAAFETGWKIIKLYFMVGLPTEEQRDIASISNLVARLKQTISSKGRPGKINVSVATFIPKPHTPFQWTAQDGLEEAQGKMETLRRRLRSPGIHFKWQNPRVSQIEGLWARGDRRLGRLLVAAYHRGCVFDGWSDRFDYRRWRSAIEDADIDVDFYTSRPRSVDEPLPWDHIDTGITKDYLKSEWCRALAEEFTPDCRLGDCNGCGVCDFKRIAPRTHADFAVLNENTATCSADPPGMKLELRYVKEGAARFFGHLETGTIFSRALRRARIPVQFSRGFHPKPKISFSDPLPVGMEGRHEILRMTVSPDADPQRLADDLNRQLPAGLSIIDCRRFLEKTKPKAVITTYEIVLRDGIFNKKDVKCFLEKRHWPAKRTNRKGRESVLDLKEIVASLTLLAPDTLRVGLLSAGGAVVRPDLVMRNVFGVTANQCKTAYIVKKSVEDATMLE